MLFVLVPALAVAQNDSVNVVVDGVPYGAYPAAFGTPFVMDETIGPAPIVQADPYIACIEDPANPGSFLPSIDNPEEIEGNIALISRGACPFVIKVQAASEAGAIAVVMVNNVEGAPIVQGGACEPEVCTIPSAMVSLASGLAILDAVKFGAEGSIVPIFITPPPPVATSGTHDTGTVVFDVFDYGFLGANVSFLGNGFVFEGENGLFVSSVLFGVDGNVVSNPYDGLSEWTKVTDVTTVTPPSPFDQAFQTSFENEDIGILTTMTSYSRAGDPFVIVDLSMQNTSGSDINDAYIGLFADWDAGSTSVDDAAGVNNDLNLVYVYDPVEDVPYFGVVARVASGGLSGYSGDASDGSDAQLWEALTTPVEPAGGGVERAAVSGVGPFNIAAGTSVSVQFAYVAGADEADLFANAQDALDIGVAAEETTPEGTFVLESAYPNPFAARTNIGFTLPTAQDVRLTVYDVLGRQVAVLVDGVRQAGPQTVVFDASSLPSGMYIYRLEAGSTQLMERVTLVR